MLLDGYTPTVRNSWWVDDAIIISYIQQDWAPVGVPTVEADDLLNAEFTTEDVKEDAVAGTVEIETYGAIDSPRLVSLVSDFKLRDSGEPSRIWGGYSHNIAPEPTGSIKSISGGGQGISVELSVGAAAHFNPASATDPR
ncbi:hypothetical protein [Halorubrum sp. FL23]|uniref:hypothetical protein n=1 Tax=Halorubrum sp. FL23 TaxID=3458704 RepID=UPI004034222A